MDHEEDIRLDSNASVLQVLLYYDVFNYPLTETEILEYSNLLPNEGEKCKLLLQELIQKGILYKIDNYFSLSNDVQRVKDRIDGNEKAVKWMDKARENARIIATFPYVRAVLVSGSLSKGILSDDPDIDYFIITKPNRLWFARTLLIIYKKLFLANSHKYFCVNYFIDSANLEIEEHNLFTATEIITMIQLYGNGIGDQFYKKNNWVRYYYPNFKKQNSLNFNNQKSGFVKKSLEYLFNNHLGNWIDSQFMNISARHWRKKFGDKYSQQEFDLAFKTDKHISKHHPQNFQLKVKSEFLAKKHLLEMESKINLEKVVFQSK